MRRIIMLLTVVALLLVMVAMSAVPAFAFAPGTPDFKSCMQGKYNNTPPPGADRVAFCRAQT